MSDLPHIVAACEFDGTVNSVRDFLPEGEYTVDESNQQLKLKDNDNQIIVAQIGWFVIQDSRNTFMAVEPAVYKVNYEHMLTKD